MAHVPSAVNDKFTVDDIAMKVSRALDLPTTNRELGRSIIREALQAADMGAFKELASNYGTFDLEFTEQLYEGIRSVDARLKRAAAAKAKAAQAEGPEDPSAPSVLPFSRSFGTRKEQLAGEVGDGDGSGGGAGKRKEKRLKGGLVLPKGKSGHVFKRPQAREALP
jgi:hypothetical protein